MTATSGTGSAPRLRNESAPVVARPARGRGESTSDSPDLGFGADPSRPRTCWDLDFLGFPGTFLGFD